MTGRGVRWVVGLLVAASAAGCAADPAPPNGSLVPVDQRRPIAAIAGESLLEPGRTVATDAPAGAVTVVNVWGAWCGPCRFETPELARAHAETESDGVRFIGINVRDHVRSYPVDFVADNGVEYPSIYDPPGRTLLNLGRHRNVAVPTTVVLDGEHRVAAVFTGAVLADDLLPRIREVLAEGR
ncbi:TlpA disulfide reductase family protein [Actinokineospora sp. NPDC004072]